MQISTTAPNGRHYIKHTRLGTDHFVGNMSPGWEFFWKAPDTGVGTVTFYFACNMANGDFWLTGDFIYTRLRPGDPVVVHVQRGPAMMYVSFEMD